jgi:hypothetical protein
MKGRRQRHPQKVAGDPDDDDQRRGQNCLPGKDQPGRHEKLESRHFQQAFMFRSERRSEDPVEGRVDSWPIHGLVEGRKSGT